MSSWNSGSTGTEKDGFNGEYKQGPTIKEFNPSESLVKSLNSGKGTKHVKGDKISGERARRVVSVSSSSDEDS